jgi:hypothetical protein
MKFHREDAKAAKWSYFFAKLRNLGVLPSFAVPGENA